MKYFTSFLLVIALFACNKSKPAKQVVETNQTIEALDTKPIYKEVIQTSVGDIAGLQIGENKTNILTFLKSKTIDKSQVNTISYSQKTENSENEVNLGFKNDTLVQIAMDINLVSKDLAAQLFDDIRNEFFEKYGSKYLQENDEDNTIMYWSKNEKEVQLILEENNVHIYIDTEFAIF